MQGMNYLLGVKQDLLVTFNDETFSALSAVPVWERHGSTPTFYLTPEIEKSYVANQSTNALFDGGIFPSMQRQLIQAIEGQLGLTVAATSNASLSRSIWDDADSVFYNYTYRYKIQHTHVAAKRKLLADAGLWLVPWVSGSIGEGFNNAHGFHSAPTLFEAIPTLIFHHALKQASRTRLVRTYKKNSISIGKSVWAMNLPIGEKPTKPYLRTNTQGGISFQSPLHQRCFT